MGSTSNALDKGGDNFKKLYNNSDVTKTKQEWPNTLQVYILCLFLWNGIMRDLLIRIRDTCIYHTPQEGCIRSSYGDVIDIGVIEHWNNEAEGLKV